MESNSKPNAGMRVDYKWKIHGWLKYDQQVGSRSSHLNLLSSLAVKH